MTSKMEVTHVEIFYKHDRSKITAFRFHSLGGEVSEIVERHEGKTIIEFLKREIISVHDVAQIKVFSSRKQVIGVSFYRPGRTGLVNFLRLFFEN